MHWKLKAAIQNAISLLPPSVSGAAYYGIQRNYGALRNYTPMHRVPFARKTWELLIASGEDPVDKVFFEVGTGRVPILPLCFWLMGAKKTITYDLNRYLKDSLFREAVNYIKSNQDEFRQAMLNLIDEDRFRYLMQLSDGRITTENLLKVCCITYNSPGDASATGLDDSSVDYHTSCNVLEHIPAAEISCILTEGVRTLRKEGGMLVHRVDYSDHFSHSDRSISAINFLKLNSDTWKKYAGNQYMYANRLRHDDLISVFRKAGLEIVGQEKVIDDRCLRLLTSEDFLVDAQFRGKSTETLATTSSWIVSRPSLENGEHAATDDRGCAA